MSSSSSGQVEFEVRFNVELPLLLRHFSLLLFDPSVSFFFLRLIEE
jgi:hypothetical protein